MHIDTRIFVSGLEGMNSVRRRVGATHIISILDIGSKPPFIPDHLLDNWLYLQFDDVDRADHPSAMKDIQVQLLSDWTDKHIKDGSRVLVHCHGGVCRSTAVALWLHFKFCSHNMMHSVKWLIQERPTAQPNPHVATMIDKHEKLNGSLISACKFVRDDLRYDLETSEWVRPPMSL